MQRGRGRGALPQHAALGSDAVPSESLQKSKRKPRRRGARDAHGDLHAEPGVAQQATARIVTPSSSRGNSPLSTTSCASSTLQLMREQAVEDQRRRLKTYMALLEEQMFAATRMISDEELTERAQIERSHATAQAVSGQQLLEHVHSRVTSSTFLDRRHVQQLEALEEEEADERDHIIDEEIDVLSAFILGACTDTVAVHHRSDRITPVQLQTDDAAVDVTCVAVVIDGNNPKLQVSEVASPSQRTPELAVAADADDAFRDFRPPPRPPAPRTAESVCPCSLM